MSNTAHYDLERRIVLEIDGMDAVNLRDAIVRYIEHAPVAEVEEFAKVIGVQRRQQR